MYQVFPYTFCFSFYIFFFSFSSFFSFSFLKKIIIIWTLITNQCLNSWTCRIGIHKLSASAYSFWSPVTMIIWMYDLYENMWWSNKLNKTPNTYCLTSHKVQLLDINTHLRFWRHRALLWSRSYALCLNFFAFFLLFWKTFLNTSNADLHLHVVNLQISYLKYLKNKNKIVKKGKEVKA